MPKTTSSMSSLMSFRRSLSRFSQRTKCV